MRHVKCFCFLVLTVTCVPLYIAPANAADSCISYQGVLAGSDGKAVPDGNYAMQFALWTAETGGTCAWGPEVHGAVSAQKGAFAVQLGSITSFGPTLFKDNAQLWLEISADTGAGMRTFAPRAPLTGSPWAAQAENASNADALEGHGTGDFAPVGHGHSSLDAADGSATHVVAVDNTGTVNVAGPVDMGPAGANAKIVNLADPSDPRDAATKGYVDGKLGAGVDLFVHTFKLAAGESVVPGDVLHFLNGEAVRGKTSPFAAFNQGRVSNIATVMMSASQILIAYRDVTGGGIGTAVIGSVAGPTMTFGAKAVFNNAATDYVAVAALSESQVVVAFKDSNGYGTVVVGAVSGPTVTFGDKTTFNGGDTYSISIAALSATKFVVICQDGGNGYFGTARIGHVSGSAISSWGAKTVYNGAASSYGSVAALSDSRFVVAYRDDDNSSFGAANVGSVSGSTVTFGPKAVFNSAESNYMASAALSGTQVAVIYQQGDSQGNVVIGTVSDTAITFGPAVQFGNVQVGNFGVASLSGTAFIVGYQEKATNTLKCVSASMSGSTAALGEQKVMAANALGSVSVAAASASQYWVAYGSQNPDAGAIASNDTGFPLGIAAAAATGGQNVPVVIAGVSPYHADLASGILYYEGMGGLTSTPSLYPLGRAISATELLLNIQGR